MSILRKLFQSSSGNSASDASAPSASDVGAPRYEPTTPRASGNGTQTSPELASWTEFYPVLVGAETIGNLAASTPMQKAAAELTERLERDTYVDFLKQFYSTGASRAPGSWRYADITTALLAAATLARPKSYLEIGVRRGRSMAAVATVQPEVDVVGFDIWEENYGGMQNPGAEFVRSEMRRLGHRGKLELVSGDSHITVPKYFQDHPDAYFDLITVDGDHTDRGARSVLRCSFASIEQTIVVHGRKV